MESYFQEAFVTTVSAIGKFASKAYESQKQQNKIKEEKNTKRKNNNQDIGILEIKIINHLKFIKQNQLIGQKALTNLNIDKQILSIDLDNVKSNMYQNHHNKNNYMKYLIQILSKLNSISKQIKKITKCKIQLTRKRKIESANQFLRYEKIPKTAEINISQNKQQSSNFEKNRNLDYNDQYQQAIKQQLCLREKLKSLDIDNQKIKQNVKEFNLKKIKRIKQFNKKVQQVSKKQKEKQQQQYNQYVQNKKREVNNNNIKNTSGLTNLTNILSQNTTEISKSQKNKLIIYKNKLQLEEQFENKIKKIIEKHKQQRIPQRNSIQVSASLQKYNQRNQRTKKNRQEKDQFDQNYRLQKIIQKQEKIKHLEELIRIKSSNELKRHQIRQIKSQESNEKTLEQHVNRGIQKKQNILRNISDYIKNKMNDKFKRSQKIQEQNYLNLTEKIDQHQQKYLMKKKKLMSIQKKIEKSKQQQIHSNYKIRWNHIKLLDEKSKLKELSDSALQKKLKILSKNKSPIKKDDW